jgi:hypothetical protein
MNNYLKRLIEERIIYDLKLFGAVCVEGPKFVGKSETCSSLCGSKILIESNEGMIRNIYSLPLIALNGEKPRFIDE